MKTFEEYLRQNKLSVSSIHTYIVYHIQLLQWLETENIDSKTFTYNELLDYINYLQQQGNSKKTINGKLRVVRHYSDYLIQQKQREDNPASGLLVKGAIKKIPINLLDIEAMEQLCKDYNNYKHAKAMQKIMLGLLIYQGLRLKELKALKTSDIKLSEGKVLIKESTRSNGRVLRLNALQIPLLQQRIQQKETNLIAPQHLDKNRFQYFFVQLKRLNPNVINAKQIRSSVIAHWLRSNNLRQTQYMAGHRYVSSTERYQTNHIEDLQKALRIHHPNA